MRVVKYQRVSTSKQDYENQTKALDKQIELLGWDCVGEYKEVVSGVKDTRPQLQKMIEDARLRKFTRQNLCKLHIHLFSIRARYDD